MKALNNLTGNELYIGQILQISPIQGNYYIVQRGDTFFMGNNNDLNKKLYDIILPGGNAC